MRAKIEVDAEIARLQRLVPVDGPHKRNVQASIDDAIEELTCGVDTTCEEFEDQPDIVKDTVEQARAWKAETTAIRPSEGYGKLVKS